MIIPSLSPEERQRQIEKLEKIIECEERGHPYPEEGIIGAYQPGRMVFVSCSNCHGFYFREATDKEREGYSGEFIV